MKHLFVFFLLPFVSYTQHKTIGKTILLDKQNGEPLFYLNANVIVSLKYNDDKKNALWLNIELENAYYLKSSLRKNFLLKNSIIYDNKNKQIGKTLKNIKMFEEPPTKGDLDEKIPFYSVGYLKKQGLKKLNYSDFLKEKTKHFATQDQNYFVVLGDSTTDELKYSSVETSFKIIKDNDRLDKGFMLLKKKVEYQSEPPTSFNPEAFADISITVYPNIYKKDSFVFSREKVHEIELRGIKSFKFWETKTYGCCESPTKYELIQFPSGKTIFRCHSGYYFLSFSDTTDFILLGFEHQSYNPNDLNSIGKLNYTINGIENNYIKLKYKQPINDSTFNVSLEFIEFIKIDSTDKVFDWFENSKSIQYDYGRELLKYSSNNDKNTFANKFKSIYDATGIGLELNFKAYVKSKWLTKKIKVIFDKGVINKNEILLDFE